MKVLAVTTVGGTLRSKIVGWTLEDTEVYVEGKPIGMTHSPRSARHDGTQPETVLEALANGWRLLGPPQEERRDPGVHEWWLTREGT